MDSCDLLIVGGGPSGSTLARALRGRGLDIALMDKSDFPRDKVCAGWVTPPIVEALDLDLEDYAAGGRVLQPITGFSVRRIGGPDTEVHYQGEPVSYGIRRCEFDHYLLGRSGANLMAGRSFEGMRRDGRDWIVNGEIRTPLVVGAGGHFCPVARHLGAAPGRGEITVAAQEIEFKMSPEQLLACTVRGDTPELFFCGDLKGYGWIFRKGDYLNIGLGREDQNRLGEQVREFCRYLDGLGKLPAGTLEKFKGHAYLLYDHARRRTLDDGVLLIGDAAGLAYTRSGEGIRPAVESALIAAEVICLAGGDYRAAGLRKYDEMITKRFGRRRLKGIADQLPALVKQNLGEMLLSTRFFIRNFVIDRWFLHRKQKALKVGAK